MLELVARVGVLLVVETGNAAEEVGSPLLAVVVRDEDGSELCVVWADD